MDQTVRQSLQEIAQLLLLIYEKYSFKTVLERDIIIHLTKFIRHIGLENKICVLDIEYCRRKIMYDVNDNNTIMGYEMFYAWLKEIATNYFRYEMISKSDKKSFHYLLTKYIIPFSSRGDDPTTVIFQDNYNETQLWLLEVDSRSLETFIEYKELIKLWFMTILTQNAGYRLTPIDQCWRIVYDLNSNIQISSNALIASFKLSGICPTFISTNQLLQLFRDLSVNSSHSSHSHQTIAVDSESSLSFIEFLKILFQISKEIQEVQHRHSDYRGNPRLRSILMYFSVTSMKNVLNHFKSEQGGGEEEEINETVSNSSDILPLSHKMSISSIIWLLRQSGFMQIESVTTRLLIEQIEFEILKYSSVSSNNIPTSDSKNKETYVLASDVPMIISHIIHKTEKIIHPLPDISISSNSDELFARWVIFLSYFLPGVLFASASKSLLMRGLPSFYTPSMLKLFNLEYNLWENTMTRYIKYRISQESSTIDDINSIGWNIKSIVEYAQSTQFIPKVISVSRFKEIAKFIVWPYDKQSDIIETINLSHMDMLETLFIISQQLISQQGNIYLDNTIAFTSLKVVLEKFTGKLINTSVTSNTTTITTTALINLDTIETIGNNHTSQDHHHPKPLTKLSVDNSYSIETYRSRAQKSIEDILSENLTLLTFFPIQSFQLNPWDISRLFITIAQLEKDKTSSSSNLEKSYTLDTNLSKILKLFSERYHILPNRLAKFFENRYEEPIITINTPISSDKYKQKGYTILKPPITEIMIDPLVKYIFEEKTLRLLYSNADLLKYEFCRIYALYYSIDITNYHKDFIVDYNLPFPVMIENPTNMIDQIDQVDQTRNQAENTIYYLLPKSYAITWAKDVAKLSEDIANIIYDMIDKCSCELQSKGMTFSTFIVYMCRTYTHMLIVKQRLETSHLVHPTNIPIALDAFINRIRDMLLHISQHLTKSQQFSRLRLLQPLFSHFTSSTTTTINNNNSNATTETVTLTPRRSKLISLDHMDSQNILNITLFYFKSHLIKLINIAKPITTSSVSDGSVIGIAKSISDIRFLPPRPPEIFWDAPRFVEYCKYIGILHSIGIGSIACVWYSYGAYLRSLKPPGIDSWPDHVVPPLPIKPDSKSIAIIMEHIVRLSENDRTISGWITTYADGMTFGFQYLLNKVILPLICSVMEKNYRIKQSQSMKQTMSTEISNIAMQSITSTMEDMLRYGGDQLIVTLDSIRSWIISSYESLLYQDIQNSSTISIYNSSNNSVFITPTKSSDNSSNTTATVAIKPIEPSIQTISRFLCCHGLLTDDIIIILAKRSLQPRIRPIISSIKSSTSLSLSLSLSEYEELFLRCSFVVWEICGAAAKFNPSPDEFLRHYQKMNTTPIKSTINSTTAIENLQFVAQSYCNECNRMAADRSMAMHSSNQSSNNSNNNNNKSSVKTAPTTNQRSTWGIDFVKPYYNIIRQYGGLQSMEKLIRSSESKNSNDNNNNSSSSSSSITIMKLESAGSINMNLFEAHLEMKANDPMSNSKSIHPKLLYRDKYVSKDKSEFIAVTESTKANFKDTIAINTSIIQDNDDNSNSSDSIEIPIKFKDSKDIKSDMLIDRYDHYIADPVIRKMITSPSSPSVDKKVSNLAKKDLLIKPNEFLDVLNDDLKDYEEVSAPTTPANKPFTSSSSSIRLFSTSTQSPLVGSNKKSNSIPIDSSVINSNTIGFSYSQTSINASLLEGTKEILWPVYATYCSCGDSSEPGKLSGPNLFALLSKLGVLTDQTVLSDVGILLHQISSHSHSYSPLGMGIGVGSATSPIGNNTENSSWGDSPSLTFEEFLIYLCAFSQLRFEGEVSAPLFVETDKEIQSPISSSSSSTLITSNRDQATWFEKWQRYMTSSISFRRLLEECILPILHRHPVLASPEDARQRDKYTLIFSLEVLLAIDGAEQPLLSSFEYERDRFISTTPTPPSSSPMLINSSVVSLPIASPDQAFEAILYPLQCMNLIPEIMTIAQVRQLINDIIPNKDYKDLRITPQKDSKYLMSMLKFPCWEWVIAVVAYQAVESAVHESSVPTDPLKIPTLMANLISSIASAIRIHQTQ